MQYNTHDDIMTQAIVFDVFSIQRKGYSEKRPCLETRPVNFQDRCIIFRLQSPWREIKQERILEVLFCGPFCTREYFTPDIWFKSLSGSFSKAAANRSNTGSPETSHSFFSTEHKAYPGTSILLCTKAFRESSLVKSCNAACSICSQCSCVRYLPSIL